MRFPSRSGLFTALCGIFTGLNAAAAPAPAATIAIEHARIHTGEGPAIEDGTLVIKAGRIAAVGAAAAVAIPADAVRVDGKDGWLTAGLFDAESRVGLNEVSLEPSTIESALDARYDTVRPAFAVEGGWNPASVLLPVTRLEGVTNVALVPDGGLVSGRGAVVDLAGTGFDATELVVAAPSAVYVHYGDAGKANAFGARGGALLRLRELVDDVRQYDKRRADFEKNQMRHVAASRLDLEAMIPAVSGKPQLPLVVEVHRAADILAVLRLARDEKLRVILTGCEEGWRVAKEIAAAGVPVIVKPLADLPSSFETLGTRLDNAALLAKAGVTIALSPRLEEPHNGRTLRIEAGNAVANGLPFDEALRAVTKTPAQLFGVGDRLGTLAPGKIANVVLWSGDPFETSTRVKKLYVRGRDVPLVSRQTLLRDRYRDLTGARPRADQ